MEGVRLDKWLWAARFYKTRSLAAHEIEAGRVQVDGAAAKPARELAVGDRVSVRRTAVVIDITVCALSRVRGPASVAAGLYEETEESLARRERLAEQRRLAPEPGGTLEAGRPTKRNRRLIDRWRGR